MSEARGQQQEPSMEEILASIRRIISEDGSPAQDPVKGKEPPEPEPAEASQAAPASIPGGVTEAEDDALLLTEMVTDDGTVVSLSGQQPAAIPAEPTPIEPAPEPPLPEPAMEAAPPPPRPAASPPAPARKPVPEPEPEPELGVLEPDAKPEPQPAPEPEPMMDESEEPDMPAVSRTMESEPDEARRLVSDATFAASTAALSQLSRTVRKDKDFSFGGGRMVEDLVREALEPMLKEWLDANLQTIVERLVRQEIERMVRRAEED